MQVYGHLPGIVAILRVLESMPSLAGPQLWDPLVNLSSVMVRSENWGRARMRQGVRLNRISKDHELNAHYFGVFTRNVYDASTIF